MKAIALLWPTLTGIGLLALAWWIGRIPGTIGTGGTTGSTKGAVVGTTTVVSVFAARRDDIKEGSTRGTAMMTASKNES